MFSNNATFKTLNFVINELKKLTTFILKHKKEKDDAYKNIHV
jgi:hypothetical protein